MMAGQQGHDWQQQGQPQSRFNIWKRPSPDKDFDEFKTPGPIGKPVMPHSHSNMQQFESLAPFSFPSVAQNDNTWSVNATAVSGWPSSDGPMSTSTADSKESHHIADSSIAEFEPGKPWKGFGAQKNIEDDPHITPGSVARSLSVNTIKEPEIILRNVSSVPSSGSNDTKTSPADMSFTSSTWSYTPGLPSQSNTSAFSKVPNKASGNWTGDPPSTHPPTSLTSELWGAPYPPKNNPAANRPPPGFGQHKSGWNIQGASGQGGQYTRQWSDNRSYNSSKLALHINHF